MKISKLGKNRAYLIIQWPEFGGFLSIQQIERKFRPEFKFAKRIKIKRLQYSQTLIFS